MSDVRESVSRLPSPSGGTPTDASPESTASGLAPRQQLAGGGAPASSPSADPSDGGGGVNASPTDTQAAPRRLLDHARRIAVDIVWIAARRRRLEDGRRMRADDAYPLSAW